jgi:hypothetical protein
MGWHCVVVLGIEGVLWVSQVDTIATPQNSVSDSTGRDFFSLTLTGSSPMKNLFWNYLLQDTLLWDTLLQDKSL